MTTENAKGYSAAVSDHGYSFSSFLIRERGENGYSA